MASGTNFSKIALFAVDNLSSIVFGLWGVAFLSRVFGPEDLGRLSAVQASTAILVVLATVGLDHYWVRELSRNSKDSELISTGQLTQWLGWLMHFFALIVLTGIQGNLERDFLIVVAVAVSTLFARAFCVSYFFVAIGRPRPIAISAVISRVFALGYLYCGSVAGLSYEWMIMYLPLQAIIQCSYLVWIFLQEGRSWLRWEIKWGRVLSLVREARPLLLATAIFPFFAQADILIISHYLNAHDVGIYSAASRLLPQLLFLGHIFASAFFPLIVKNYDANTNDAREYILAVARTITMISLGASIFVFLFSYQIIYLLYGEKFLGSVEVIKVACWSWIFMLPAALYSRLLILHGAVHIELIKTFVTSAVSVCLNMYLIPIYGMLAAAIVSVFSYFLADFALYLFFPKTRPMFLIALQAFTDLFVRPVVVFRATKKLLFERSKI
jgi:O-antigen/teichoic acid export membrane protein